MLRALKLITFHILLSCRWFVLAVSKFFALAFISVFVMSLSIDKLSTLPLSVKILMAIFGMIFTAIFWFYDYLIFYLKPKTLELMLFK